MVDNVKENLNTSQEINKEEGLWGKIGDFFERIGYSVAKFAIEHPYVTRASVVLLSTVAGYFTGGGLAGAIGGAVAGVQRSGDVIEFCAKFANEYEIEIKQKEASRSNSIGSRSSEHALSQDKHLENDKSNINYHNHHVKDELKRHPEINHDWQEGKNNHRAKDIVNNRSAHNNTHIAGV